MTLAAIEDLRLVHLREANEIRTRRAALKSAIASGRVSLAETLEADHDWTRTMRVVDLLRVTPGLGPIRVKRALIANRLTTTLTLERFSDRRRQELLAWLSVNCPSASVFPKAAGE
jgi:hypothetical protein